MPSLEFPRQPAGPRLDDLLHAIDHWTQDGLSRSKRRLAVCDTPARSAQKGRVLHRDVSAVRFSDEHDDHQAGYRKWRNQPIERE
jgi:hypothetical protein